MNRQNFCKIKIVLLILTFFFSEAFGQGQFFREYWAEYDSTISVKNLNYWRVNDESVSLHKKYGHRIEPKANGLVIIPIDEDLFELDKAELYMELWAGHTKTENKRFYLNGRGPYNLARTGIEDGYYSFSFPTIPLKIENLVRGKNAFQFAIDKGRSGWGHFMVNELALKCYLNEDHPDLVMHGIDKFNAFVKLNTENEKVDDVTPLSLTYPARFESIIDSVLYFARYTGFDDKGFQKDNYWHGITVEQKPINHVGSSSKPPFIVNWDTEMFPDQPGSMAIKAIVYFNNGIHYQTESIDNLYFRENRPSVKMYKCEPFPPFFASRVSVEKTATLTFPNTIENIDKVELMVKNWGKHKGHNEGPFKLNGKPIDLFSDVVSKIFAFSKIKLNAKDILPGKNTFSVFSDSKHHSLEIFLPGPVLIVKEKSKN